MTVPQPEFENEPDFENEAEFKREPGSTTTGEADLLKKVPRRKQDPLMLRNLKDYLTPPQRFTPPEKSAPQKAPAQYEIRDRKSVV